MRQQGLIALAVAGWSLLGLGRVMGIEPMRRSLWISSLEQRRRRSAMEVRTSVVRGAAHGNAGQRLGNELQSLTRRSCLLNTSNSSPADRGDASRISQIGDGLDCCPLQTFSNHVR